MTNLATLHGPADAVAVTALLAAIFNALPIVLGVLGGILGIVWYGVLFYDRFYAKGVKADTEEGA